MRLYEFEAKQLAKKYGISIPLGEVVSSSKELNPMVGHGVVKAQVLANKRMKQNGVVISKGREDLKSAIDKMIANFVANEKVQKVLVEEIVEIEKEFYLSIIYDTSRRCPVVIFNVRGGIDVEENGVHSIEVPINPITGIKQWEARQMALDAGFKGDKVFPIADVIQKTYNFFAAEDARVVEINPLAQTKEGKFVAVGVIVDLDDDAAYKHKERNYPPREVGLGREMTEREIAVKKANSENYQGTVKYLEFDGDIGFMAAGGGGSMVCMDALIQAGGKPANYAEHSGDPTKEKVYTLAKMIMSKPGIRGLWIVGAIANFTRIDITMQGVAEALAELKPKFPIVVRRSGPGEKEGLQLLKDVALQHGLDLEVHGSQTPITTTAETIVQKAYGGK